MSMLDMITYFQNASTKDYKDGNGLNQVKVITTINVSIIFFQKLRHVRKLNQLLQIKDLSKMLENFLLYTKRLHSMLFIVW